MAGYMSRVDNGGIVRVFVLTAAIIIMFMIIASTLNFRRFIVAGIVASSVFDSNFGDVRFSS